MSSLSQVIRSVVVDIGTNAQKINFYRVHPNIDEVQKLTISYLSNVEDGYYKNKKHLIHDAKIVYSIYAQLCRFGYYKTLPDWTMVVKKAFQNIIECDNQEDIVRILTKQEEIVKECVQKAFVFEKQLKLGNDFLLLTNNYVHSIGLLPEYSPNGNESIRNDIANKAHDRFYLYYDPKHPDKRETEEDESVEDVELSIPDRNAMDYAPWKTFLWQRFRMEEKSYFKKEKGSVSTDGENDDDGENDTDSTGGIIIKAPDTFKENEERIWLYDTLRDLGLSIKKFKDTKTRTKGFVCFFTDDISYLLNESNHFYNHLQEHEKSYTASVNMDFLNFFIDYHCSSILDAYSKARKPKSTFNTKDTQNDNEPCGYPLELYVFADFFNMSEGTFSNYRQDYNRFRREYVEASV